MEGRMSEEKKVVESNAKEEASKMDEFKGMDGAGVEITTGKGRKYTIMPSSLGDIPDLRVKLEEYDKVRDLLDKSTVGVMADIVLFGTREKHPKITKEEILKTFCLPDFPVALNIIMGLNDFFAKMREIAIQRKAIETATKK
jgi:hypothetical protein